MGCEPDYRENHKMLVNLTAQVPGVVYQYRLYPDGSSAFPFSSTGMNDIYEFSPEEVREDATPVFGRLHPDDYDRVAAAIQESARTLEPFHCEFRVVLPRQGLKWRLSDALPERMEDGSTLWHGTISDITERVESESALARTTALLSRTGEMAKVGGWELDLRTMDLFWSPETYRIHEVDPSVAPSAAQQANAFYPPEAQASIDAMMKAAIEDGTPWDYELPLTTAAGRRIWVRGTGAAETEDGRAVMLRGSLQDVTERRQAQEELRRSEAAVRERLRVILEPEGDIGALNLSDVIDEESLQSMMQEFYRLTGLGIGIVDLSGNVIVKVGWQDICTKYHRINPETLKDCRESDLSLSEGVRAGEFKAYHCQNNLWDVVTPIEIGGKHLGNVFLGQFFYEDETIDYDLFRRQAGLYGFDETEYLAALDRVPRLAHETVDAAMSFHAKLAAMISSSGYGTIQLSRTLAQKDALLDERDRALERLVNSLSSVVEIVSKVVETRDPYTAGHQRRVSELAVRISRDMGMTAKQIEEIRIAALIHDVGKMSVPAEILSKPGELSIAERVLIKEHAETGYRIISSADMAGPVAEIVYQHHERCDGSGYPRGLSAEELLPESKVLMVADVVEAMSSHRPYRAALGREAGLAEIEQGAGTIYDAEVCRVCIHALREPGFDLSP